MRSTFSLLLHREKMLPAAVLVLALSTRSAVSQVSPNEIPNPDLRALEQTYFRQLIGINQSVTKAKFPFPLYLSRYVGLDPAKQAEADSRGLEFVRFQDRTILKITGRSEAPLQVQVAPPAPVAIDPPATPVLTQEDADHMDERYQT